jgi:hypothetical protein
MRNLISKLNSKFPRFLVLGISFLSLLMIQSCEEIPIDLADPVLPDSDRVVIIEELTGASCPNCPKGSAAINAILAKFPNKVAAVAIHGDFLAKPTAKSKYDFRNPKAKDLEKSFEGWFGKPTAAINRALDNTGNMMIDLPDLWQAAVERELQKDHQMNIVLKADYNESTRIINLEVAAIPLNDLSGNYNISIYLNESNIVDAQSNGALIIEDYVHKHVLRDMFTRFSGDELGSNLVKGNIIKRNYTYTLPTLPQGLWIPENMEIVVMVSRNNPSDQEVIQAAQTKLIK